MARNIVGDTGASRSIMRDVALGIVGAVGFYALMFFACLWAAM